MVKKLLLPLIFKRISAVLYASKANRQFYKIYRVSDEKLFFAPTATNNDFFFGQWSKLKDRREMLRQEYGLKSNDFVILFVGKLVQRKRPGDILRAVDLIASNSCNASNICVWFIGEGPERRRLEQDAIALRKKGVRVHLWGFKNQSELPLFYTLSDVFVFPSRIDLHPLVINEAMCCQLPMICTDRIGWAGDLVINGETGFIYRCGDISQLAVYLRKLLEDPDLRYRMGVKAQNRVQQKYSADSQVEGIVQAVKYVVSKS